MEESIYQDLLEKEAIFWLRFARKSIIALLIFFFFHFHILFGLKPKEEIESECQKVGRWLGPFLQLADCKQAGRALSLGNSHL